MFIILLVIAALFAFYVLSPLFSREWSKKRIESVSDRENLLYKKEEIFSSLNDLEYDFKLKKVNETDYLQLKDHLKQEAIEIMKKLDNMDGLAKENAVSFPTKQRVHGKVRS